MPKKTKAYTFSLRISDESIKKWMDHQNNKNESICLILKRAINEFGYSDINELLTNAFLKNDPRFGYKTSQSEEPEPNTETVKTPTEIKEEPKLEQPKEEPKKSKPKPSNFSFLSQ